MFPQTVSFRNNPLIYSLIGVNLLGYVLIQQLMPVPNYCFAGLQSYMVIAEGEYWRIISSIFVHYDLSHLLFNMVALLIFGSYAERFLGLIPALCIYLLSGFIANCIALIIVYFLNQVNYCAIGASGAILGLAAGTACVMLRIWREFRNPVALIFARQLAIILLIQFGLDFIIKENSFIHHFVGALSGFLLALIIHRRKRILL